MTGHTKEPWRVGPKYPADIQGASGRKEVATTNPIGLDDDDPRAPSFRKQVANARRIVDCVNALAGVPDPAAFVAAFEGMREALEYLVGLGGNDCLDPAIAALTAARQARGEG